jgi:hypothetical protein
VPTIMMRRTVPLLLALSAVVTVAATKAAEHALAASKNITGGASPHGTSLGVACCAQGVNERACAC